MKRYPGMNIMRAMLLVVALVMALVAAACGGEQSVASKSAAAYREAQARGTPVGGGHDHGGHGATATTASADHSAHGATTTGDAATDHSAHGTGADAQAGMNHGATAGGTMDHSAHGGAATVDHAAMGHGTGATNAHAGHATTRGTTAADHAAMGHGSTSTNAHAGHTATTNAHAQHGAGATSIPAAAPAPRSSAEMQRLQPATTLRRDAFDAPASVSVSEAAKAAQGGSHEGHGTRGITAGEDHENPPTPMPATRDGSNRTSAVDHSQHSATGAQPTIATVYACPMHPEVTSDNPGTCPKCGMTLVKKNG